MKNLISLRLIFSFLLLTMAFGCTVLAARHLSEQYGAAEVRPRLVPVSTLPPARVDYWKEIKPILDNRCVVCHSCSDAPCQAKLTSPAGIDRGASKTLVYQSSRLVAQDPTRLSIDADTTSEWREKDFFPILNEREQSPAANLKVGVLFRLLDMKRKNAAPPGAKLPDNLDLSLARSQVCPRDIELESHEKNFPDWGMPFGFPALIESEFSSIKNWLESGALVSEPPALSPEIQATITKWEHFLNGDSPKEQLMSRYLYEHLYLGDLFFDNLDAKHHFKLIRSKTPPGEPVSRIRSRRPTDAPGVARPYYRIVEYEETIVSKSFIPYALNENRMERFRELFLTPTFVVKALPSYEPDIATNPFRAFEALPVKSRYRFMLDDAQFFVMGFMKSPVCRGQEALNVIQDQFWVLFLNPEAVSEGESAEFLAKESEDLRLPASEGSATLALKWARFAKSQKKYVTAKRDYFKRYAQTHNVAPTLDAIWDGEGKNNNAALTVFRNFDSASVASGLVGPEPKTVWLIGYALLERMHYLLTVDFDVFGNYGHQLHTRLYMDFLRIEAENNFLLLLPKEIREKEHANWYRGIGANRHEYALSSDNFNWIGTGVKYTGKEPKRELLGMLQERVSQLPASVALKQNQHKLMQLDKLHGRGISTLPETTFIRVKAANGKDLIFTLVLNRAHENVAVLYLEKFTLLPDEDTLTVYPGILGSYPNAFMSVDESELDQFITAISSLDSESSYEKLLDRFGIRRTRADFWTATDWFQQQSLAAEFPGGGLLDYSRVENR